MVNREYVDHSLELQSLQRVKVHPITTADRTTNAVTTFGRALAIADEGVVVYDTDLNQLMVWDGSAWQTAVTMSVGQFRDSVTTLSQAVPSNLRNGDWVVSNVNGTLTNFGSATVNVGDIAFYNGTAWTWVESNRDVASTTTAGIVQLATQIQAAGKSATDVAVTPASLASFAQTYTTTTNLTANTPATITHNLNNQNVVVNCYDSSNNLIALAVALVTANTLTLTSHIGLSAIRVVVQG